MSVTKGKVLMGAEVTREQREWVKKIAALHGLSLAEYIRFKTLSNPIEKEG